MQRRPETNRLIEYLRSAPHGAILSYEELSEKCNWDKREKHLLLSAVQLLYAQGIQLRSIRGVGYERLDPNMGIQYIRQYHSTRHNQIVIRMNQRLKGANQSTNPQP